MQPTTRRACTVATGSGRTNPCACRRADGTVTTSSILRARQDPEFGMPGSALYHRDCFVDGQPTSPLSSA